jgi:uncharacterized UBP type Zn finger protein
MDIIPHNKNYMLKSNGFVNLGNICYFNSLLQALLSCTCIIEVLDKIRNEKHIINNPMALYMLNLIDNSRKNNDVSNKNTNIWKTIIQTSNSRSDKIIMQAGKQEDAHEGLMIFLNIMDTIPEIKRLFQHRYCSKIYCNDCHKKVVDKEELNLVFEVQPNLKSEQLKKFENFDELYNKNISLNDFLMKQNTYIDKDFICPNPQCKSKNQKFKSTILTMIPEILPIVFKKYDNKILTPFHSTLEFKEKNSNNIMIYKLVAQIEHLGNNYSGHYYTIGVRSDGCKILNDTYVCDGELKPTKNTYMLFYVYYETITREKKNKRSKSLSNLINY